VNKEKKLIDAIVRLADEHMGGERSKTAGLLFIDIASECRQLGYQDLARIAQHVADHYIYD
jgi:CRISPR/Cas system CSM-associated protein Csm4 (group 5 of RAMP superfamily)